MDLSYKFLGHTPEMPEVLGLQVLAFGFNILGYNLRHSHIWLKWPGVWSKILPSPAHHHVHHSYHPNHINKNFAFLFPIWDVIFRTYHLPETNKDVKFGIAENHEVEYKSCLGIYFVPVINTFKRIIDSLQKFKR